MYVSWSYIEPWLARTDPYHNNRNRSLNIDIVLRKSAHYLSVDVPRSLFF